MLIPKEHVRHCLDRTREITAEYKQYIFPIDVTRKSADDLLDACEAHLGVNIDVFDVNEVGNGVTKAGYVRTTEQVCEIYIRSGLPEDWERFARVKEIFHIVIDKTECRDLDIYETFTAIKVPPLADGIRKSAAWESLAEACAMEFLFPYADRVVIMGVGKDIDFAKLAVTYGIPQVFIELYLSKSYMDYFAEFIAAGAAD